ncbi:MAG: hypothetical protein KFF77_01265 [Bacteroidetes bacterium]|nr:hypothetical protein [Bacteroidota bacterium]
MSAESSIRPLESDLYLPKVLMRLDALLGLRYQPHQWSDLLRLLRPAARELGYGDLNSFLVWLLHGNVGEDAIDVLAKHLTIGESYFFREIVVFSILREKILPELIERKKARGDRHIRVWSAGCSTGEEVYSIAILLDSVMASLPDWKFSVLGTDVNPVAVQRARQGQYRDWSFRDVPLDLHAAYFERTDDGKHEVIAPIREKTEFRMLNLVSAPALYPAGFDLVLCRNVMMYFTREKVKAVVQGFRRSLQEHGWLIPSLTETTLINNPGFEGVRFGDATLYRKQPHVTNILHFQTDNDPSASAPTETESPDTAEDRSTGRRNPFTSLFGRKQQERTEDSVRDLASAMNTERPAMNTERPAMNTERPASSEIPIEDLTVKAATGVESADALTQSTDGIPLNPAAGSTSDVHALLLEAREHADSGAIEQALALAQSAIATDKMDPHAHFMLGTILRERGETTQALLAFERALYLNQDFIPAHFSIGMLYEQLGHRSKARRHFSIALTLLDSLGNWELLIEPGEISARRMADIIHTLLDR